MPVRFNHMELTFPPGSLTVEFRKEVDSFFVELLGWRSRETELVGQLCHMLLPDDGQFILLAEGNPWMHSPGYDHLGLLYETRDQVDNVLALCQSVATNDHRMQLKYYDDLVSSTVTLHAFYFRWLLPIWFDVQCIELAPEVVPEKRWRYA
jgi:hypothetical protein